MRVRHLVAAADVGPGGLVRPGAEIRHGTLRGGRVEALAGPVDPATHLNLDFPDHRAEACWVVARMGVGAPVVAGEEGAPLVARVAPAALARLGRVDVGARRIAWLEAAGRAR